MSSGIHFGNCFDLIKNVEKNSVDLIITDPPYNISRNSNFKNSTDNKKFNSISLQFGDWDQSEIDLDNLFKECKRVLKKGGTLIIFYDVWKSNNLKKFAEKYHLKQPRVGQWVKSNPVPVNSKINYLSNAIEYFFLFTNGKKSVFNSEYDKAIYKYPICHGSERTTHPTQKPLKLFEDLLKKHSNENDLILDPFGGSGTTAEAAINCNRKFLVFENDLGYYNLIINRINNLIEKNKKIKVL